MKEIYTQIRITPDGIIFVPFSEKDQEAAQEFKPNQIVKNNIFGNQKERSLIQLRLYWAACGFIADNTEVSGWNTKEKVDFHCRVGCHFVNPDLICVKRDGSVQFSYRSIAMKNLTHIEACNYFNQAFDIMVDFYNTEHGTKIDRDTFLEMVKKSMKGGA
jgi:hypothetical protein